jgi:enoyl-CoA hydratase/carnithine racemase
MSHEHIDFDRRDRLAVITINRPEAMNALNLQANRELRAAFHAFRDDPELFVAIITGAGERAFCAGADLKELAELSASGQRPAGDLPFGTITKSFECPKPIIAAVNGLAVGGGLELAMACDLVVAAESARFGLREPRVGVIAGSGGIHRLARQVPLKHAMGLMLTARLIDAAEAYRIGFINELVPGPEVLAAAERWAGEILECSPTAVQLTKESVMNGLTYTVDDALALERANVLPRLYASEDFLEGPRAFAEKRRPNWTGR